MANNDTSVKKGIAIALAIILAFGFGYFIGTTHGIQINFSHNNVSQVQPAASASVSAVPATAEQVQTTAPTEPPETTEPAPSTAAKEKTTASPQTTAATTAAPETTKAPATTAQSAPTTTAAPAFSYQPLNKKGDLYRAEGQGKIWANLVGSCYMLFKNIDTPNEWGEKGKVYELYVTYIRVGESYSMWADGQWSLDKTGTKLTMTPVNQGENGSIGVAVGESKTFTAENGVFQIPITFERGGSTTIVLDLQNSII